MRLLPFALLLSFAMSVTAFGDYTLTPQVGDDVSITVVGMGAPGFDLDLLLTSDAADEHYAATFTVEFSVPGVEYSAYTWGAPHETGGVDDYSEPALGSLPVTIDVNTYADDPNFDPGTNDVWFENVTPLGTDGNEIDVPFTTGTLLTMSLVVPESFTRGIPITITTVPDTFDDGFQSIPTTGASYIIIPEIFGDATRNGYVDDFDLSLVLANWKQDVDWANGNFNNDNIVDDKDLSLVLGHWHDGTVPPAPPAGGAIPEPTTLVLLGLGAVAMLRRKRA